MRRAPFDPDARGIDCAVKRDDVIGARDLRTLQGQRAFDAHQPAEDMTAPMIKRTPKLTLIKGRRPDMSVLQAEARYRSPLVCRPAQAFLSATATLARLYPRRRRGSLTQLLRRQFLGPIVRSQGSTR
jgi:hypothetical protein